MGKRKTGGSGQERRGEEVGEDWRRTGREGKGGRRAGEGEGSG